VSCNRQESATTSLLHDDLARRAGQPVGPPVESTDIANLRENFADRSKFEKIWVQRGFKVEM
jgi:hypothetical protein